MSDTTENKCTCEEDGYTCNYCGNFPDDTTEEERKEFERALDEALSDS